MHLVEPSVALISRPSIDTVAIFSYLEGIGGDEWYERVIGEPITRHDGEVLIEFGGRLCYRSWVPGLNANVSKVREDSGEYLGNILESGHGSVLEHANYSFIISDVSRVFTHELVRHRAGTAFSQESMRYVRLTDIPFWFPDWAKADSELMVKLIDHVEAAEALQGWMTDHFGLDDPGVPFAEKKAKTSFMRRFAPDGLATSILFTANVRALRHVISMRTDFAAEEEIRIVFDAIADLMAVEVPNLFQDFSVSADGVWKPTNWKV